MLRWSTGQYTRHFVHANELQSLKLLELWLELPVLELRLELPVLELRLELPIWMSEWQLLHNTVSFMLSTAVVMLQFHSAVMLQAATTTMLQCPDRLDGRLVSAGRKFAKRFAMNLWSLTI
ncbi:hypothetical protein COOONC_21188 [Cooperia oncophora]